MSGGGFAPVVASSASVPSAEGGTATTQTLQNISNDANLATQIQFVPTQISTNWRVTNNELRYEGPDAEVIYICGALYVASSNSDTSVRVEISRRNDAGGWVNLLDGIDASSYCSRVSGDNESSVRFDAVDTQPGSNPRYRFRSWKNGGTGGVNSAGGALATPGTGISAMAFVRD